MAAGYSPNPLFKKLGLKEGMTVKVVNAPDNFKDLIGDITDQLHFKKSATSDLDYIHLFTNSARELEKSLPILKKQIKKNGLIWISWYKKSAGKPTDLTEDKIRDTALATGLVDVKVCAVDEDWSGLKLVFRLADR